jgi:DNA-binding NarL/FixJ family response regulator
MVIDRKISVLLVDDSPLMRGHILDLLEGTEFTCWEAASGEEAEHYLDSPKLAVDILLSEVSVGRRSGWDLAIQIATLRPRTKVLLMSSRYLDAVQSHGLYIRQGLYLRGAEFLPKPFPRDTLLSRLRKLWLHGPALRLESVSNFGVTGAA